MSVHVRDRSIWRTVELWKTGLKRVSYWKPDRGFGDDDYFLDVLSRSLYSYSPTYYPLFYSLLTFYFAFGFRFPIYPKGTDEHNGSGFKSPDLAVCVVRTGTKRDPLGLKYVWYTPRFSHLKSTSLYLSSLPIPVVPRLSRLRPLFPNSLCLWPLFLNPLCLFPLQ